MAEIAKVAAVEIKTWKGKGIRDMTNLRGSLLKSVGRNGDVVLDCPTLGSERSMTYVSIDPDTFRAFANVAHEPVAFDTSSSWVSIEPR